jgi:hypothetical protein
VSWLKRAGFAALSLLVAAVLSACGSDTEVHAVATQVPPMSDHACVVPGTPGPTVAWDQLRNPVLSYPQAAVKDQAIIWAKGSWHMIFSYVTNATTVPDQQRWDIGTAQSTNLVRWTGLTLWSEQPGGMASPDIVREPDGAFVVTYDSPPGENGTTQAKLYYRTSTDLVRWSAPMPLAGDLHPSPSDRLIDPALAWTGNGIMLGFKLGTTSQTQAFEIARSASGSLSGPWSLVGRPDESVYGDTFENYEFLSVAGKWRLVATSNTFDQPWIYTLSGDPDTPSSWLHWVDGYELQVPSQQWNTGTGVSSVNFEHANSAFLCQDTTNGYFYLTYAGSTELSSFGGWGHAAIGIARSRDLVHWQAPPG